MDLSEENLHRLAPYMPAHVAYLTRISSTYPMNREWIPSLTRAWYLQRWAPIKETLLPTIIDARDVLDRTIVGFAGIDSYEDGTFWQYTSFIAYPDMELRNLENNARTNLRRTCDVHRAHDHETIVQRIAETHTRVLNRVTSSKADDPGFILYNNAHKKTKERLRRAFPTVLLFGQHDRSHPPQATDANDEGQTLLERYQAWKTNYIGFSPHPASLSEVELNEALGLFGDFEAVKRHQAMQLLGLPNPWYANFWDNNISEQIQSDHAQEFLGIVVGPDGEVVAHALVQHLSSGVVLVYTYDEQTSAWIERYPRPDEARGTSLIFEPDTSLKDVIYRVLLESTDLPSADLNDLLVNLALDAI